MEIKNDWLGLFLQKFHSMCCKERKDEETKAALISPFTLRRIRRIPKKRQKSL
jgi:hypothetical protein